MKTETIQKDDYGRDMNFVFRDATGAVVDLTALTVTYKMMLENTTKVYFAKICVLDTAADGECHLVVSDGDMDQAGLYTFVLEATDGSTKNYTAKGDRYIKVESSTD